MLTHTPAHVQLESKPGERYTDTQGLHVGFWAAWVLGEPCWSDGNAIPPQSYSAQGLLSMFFLSLSKIGCSGLVHWDDPEGWDGEGGGREGQVGEYTYTHG